MCLEIFDSYKILEKYKKKKIIVIKIVSPNMTGIAVLAVNGPFGLDALNK